MEKLENCPPPVDVPQEWFLFFKFETRACTVEHAKKHWALNFAFHCPELHDVSHGEVSITSNTLTELFVSKDVIGHSPMSKFILSIWID